MKRANTVILRLKKGMRKRVVLTVVLALLLTVSVGGTLAYIVDRTASVNDNFTPGQVACEVTSEQKIRNQSNVPAYIRATVVVNWMDADGNVYGIAPVYTATTVSGWTIDTEENGIYYYDSKVDPGDTIPTPATVVVDEERSPQPGGYTLQIEVVAEAIQAEGLGAGSAKAAWAAATANN